MKKFKIIYMLCFLSVFISFPVLSDTEGDLINGVNADHYGVVDGVYSEELRIVVDDTNLHYTLSSVFYDQSGLAISDIRHSIEVGTPVVFRYYQKSSNFVLQELKIISRTELKAAKDDL